MKKACIFMMYLIFLACGTGLAIVDDGSLEGGDTADATIRVSLEECIRITLSNSFDVKLARLDLYISETDLLYSQAVFDAILYGGASYSEDKRQQVSVFSPDNNQINTYYAGVKKTLPTGTALDVQLSDTRTWNNTTFVAKNPTHEAVLNLTAVQSLGRNAFGYVDRKTVSVTKLALINADLALKDRIADLIAATEKAYIDLMAAKRNIDIYDNIIDMAEHLYDNDKKNYEMGRMEKVGLYASEANVERLKAEKMLIENAFDRAEARLKLLMNVDDGPAISPSAVLKARALDEDLSDLLKTAFARRRDYLSRKRDIEIKDITLSIKDNQRWPEVDVTASMIINGLENDFERAMGKVTVADNAYYYAGIDVEIPLENRSARSEQIKAKHEKEKAILALKKTERDHYRSRHRIQGCCGIREKPVPLCQDYRAPEEKVGGGG